MFSKERWVSPILDSIESAPLPAGRTDPGNHVSIIIVGFEGSVDITLEVWESILVLGQPRVHALPSCGAPGLAGGHGLDELSRPDYQPDLIWLPAVVLVPRIDCHGRCAGPSEAASQPHPYGRCASHGGLCIDSGGPFWFFFTSGIKPTRVRDLYISQYRVKCKT